LAKARDMHINGKPLSRGIHQHRSQALERMKSGPVVPKSPEKGVREAGAKNMLPRTYRSLD
jgi:hypothetical protein